MEPDDKARELTEEKRDVEARRKFLHLLGWGSLFSTLGIALLGAVRALVPEVLFEPPSKFKAEKPEDYPEGTVKFIADEKVFIDRDENGIYALSAKCTHLGCVVDWLEDQNGYLCPCHGAKFHRDGQNFEGPAPSPLVHLQVTVALDGRILIDKGIEVDKNFRLKV